MFVVAPAQRMQTPNSDPPAFAVYWPIVFENPTEGGYSSPVDQRTTREDAQTVADALNTTLATTT